MDPEQTRKLGDSENSGMSSTVVTNRIKKPLDMDVDEKSLLIVWKVVYFSNGWCACRGPRPVIEASSNNYASQFPLANNQNLKSKIKSIKKVSYQSEIKSNI
ncbi:hypothetical protein V8G54_007557 [Vigna mungo]|uniref:Uncharacterized protein n=1 Tax=Vigna mungo TaxID=3915 RepID=A0AAQ3P1Z8_VIGMU